MIAAITGACGYVGLNLTTQLLDAGHSVRALDRVRSPALDARAQFGEVDVLTPDSLRKALEGVDVVYHLAAKITLAQEDPVAWKINVDGVRNVATAARDARVKRMVHVSSMASFDLERCKGRLVEGAHRADDPAISVYGRSKLAGEREFLKVVESGLDGVICYPTALLGPADWSQPLSRINAVLLDSARGKIPALIAGGIDLVDVRDVALGLTLAGQHGKTGENYFIGGEYYEMLDAFQRAAQFVGRRGPRFALPMGFIRPIAAVATHFDKSPDHPLSKAALDTIAQSPRIDHAKATRELGYEPRHLDETLRDLMGFLVRERHFRT